MGEPAYDRIGRTYAGTRRPDPRIAAQITAALGDARSVVNIGAGTGSYEPGDRRVVAIEPSRRMIDQRVDAAPCAQGLAEALPFADDAFDAAMASLTIHHWSDLRAGTREMSRVARRIVIFTYEPHHLDTFWLTADYFPQITAMDHERFTTVDELCAHLGRCSVENVLVPKDCEDGFLAAFWRRPEMYLDAEIRAGMSGFQQIPQAAVEAGIAHLAEDLRSGAWDERHGHLREIDELDIGYRLVVSTRD